MPTLKLSPNRALTQTLTHTLILTPKKANKNARMNISHFFVFLVNSKIFCEMVTTLYKCYMDFFNVGLIKIEPVFFSDGRRLVSLQKNSKSKLIKTNIKFNKLHFV